MSAASVPAKAALAGAKPPASSSRLGFLRDRGVVRRDSLAADAWRLQGAARIVGDVDTGITEISDHVVIGGRLTAGEVRASGVVEVHGPCDISRLFRVKGTYRCDSTLHAGEAEFEGLAKVAGGVRVDRDLHTTGMIETPNVAATTVVVHGGIHLKGNLTANRFDATLDRASWIEEIAAEVVRIVRVPLPWERWIPTPLRHLSRRLLGRSDAGLRVLRIEAKEVELEGVDVAYLRADRITVGADCRVGRYDGHILRTHPSSRLGPSSVSPLPYGMTR